MLTCADSDNCLFHHLSYVMVPFWITLIATVNCLPLSQKIHHSLTNATSLENEEEDSSISQKSAANMKYEISQIFKHDDVLNHVKNSLNEADYSWPSITPNDTNIIPTPLSSVIQDIPPSNDSQKEPLILDLPLLSESETPDLNIHRSSNNSSQTTNYAILNQNSYPRMQPNFPNYDGAYPYSVMRNPNREFEISNSYYSAPSFGNQYRSESTNPYYANIPAYSNYGSSPQYYNGLIIPYYTGSGHQYHNGAINPYYSSAPFFSDYRRLPNYSNDFNAPSYSNLGITPQNIQNLNIAPVIQPQIPTVASNFGQASLIPNYSQGSYKIFAPYCDVTQYPTYSISQAASKTGIKFFSLAFITADENGNPTWGGAYNMSQNWYGDEISKIRQMGGDVIISFGGASGTELSSSPANKRLDDLVNHYQSVISTYNSNMIDFDIEGDATADKASVDLRNQAISRLQAYNPFLIVSYTLPVNPTGLTNNGLYMLKSAILNNAKIDTVNIMTMDFGLSEALDGSKMMGNYSITAAKSVLAQIKSIGLTDCKIGITPMIGVNDNPSEVFSLENANELTEFAKNEPWISRLSMWSINRDSSTQGSLDKSSKIQKTDFAFSKIFSRMWLNTFNHF